MRSSSDAPSIAGRQRGELSTKYTRLDHGERLPARSQNSHGRPRTPNGSLGGQPMSGMPAMRNGSMHGVPTDVEVPEPARNGLSRRAWETGTTSSALAYAAVDSPIPPPSARHDGFASSAGRVSRSGSIQAGCVQIDPEVPSSVYIPRGRNVPEEPAPQSARARDRSPATTTLGFHKRVL
ncbi:hypothetical protein FOMPIDRAFT_86380 [Fomitopsis schrenkii]|uniref:Uncharacterized protein n=1 Tax=Fomitopsis schrenkii TaxID=2126942 RepID=S8F4T3_FOMSC|nr:hypothetical protein FOMPIDRAFT_86380 [Fomitopsis schrenkii]